MTPVVWFFFSAGGVIVLVLGVALWVYARPRSVTARRVLLTVAIIYAAISIYGLSYGAGRLLTIGLRPLTPSDVPPGRSVIVLLGSGSYTAWDWDRRQFSIVDRPSANRVYEALRVFNLLRADLIISSGGLVDPEDEEEPNGQTMRDELVRLGVPPSKIVVEAKSRNTHDEAVIVASMLRSMQFEHVILVTSDIHMRRSLGVFRSEGIQAIPAIAPPVLADAPWLIPSDDGLHEAAAVAHEMIGLAYYAVRGWYRW